MRYGTDKGLGTNGEAAPPARCDRPRQVLILHVIVGLHVGGAETALLRLVQNSDPLLLRHMVISLTPRGELLDGFRTAGAEVISLNLNASRPSILEMWPFLRAVRRCKPDIIQGWMVHGNLFAWVARTVAHRRAKLAWNLRSAPFDAFRRSRKALLLTKAASLFSRSVDVLISNSNAGLDEHRRRGYSARSACVIPNGFDPERFRPDASVRKEARSALGVGDSVLFGVVGRVHPAKGHEVFIRAATRLAEQVADARFILIGRDTDDPRGALAPLIEAAGIADRTICLGERTDIDRLLPALDVLCLPSLYEGFPNAIGEAIATALPCVASRVSDVPMILGDTGITVEPGDDEGLYAAMLTMARMSPAARAEMGQRARDRVVGHFALAKTVAAYTALYRTIAIRDRNSRSAISDA